LDGSKTATISFAAEERAARVANGDTVEINGAWAFTLQPKSISGDGGAVTAAFVNPRARSRTATRRRTCAPEALESRPTW
jgi:hypothetical protein